MEEYSLEKLNSIYDNAEQEDKSDFAEKRSNILLVAGEHYAKNKANPTTRLKDEPSDRQKLRLTKNHIPKVVDYYVESILSQAPSVKVLPKNPSEMQDQKEAELNQSVWEDGKYNLRLRERIREYCQSFVVIGENWVKLTWNPNKGALLGYYAKTGDNGEVLVDEMGQPQQGEPVYAGDFDIEEIYGFNLLRDPAADCMRDSSYLIVRKMAEAAELKKIYAGDEDKLRMIKESDKETFVVFDSNKKSYNRTKGQVLIREFYFRPCMEYPNGYFYITTEHGVLEQGELPFGIFPIVGAVFDKHPTLARGKSIIKRARPYQAEINRAASQQAMHQITIGDDKLIYQSGTKLSQGALLPGVRGITYQGMKPEILSGRDGSQYTAYIESNINELYAVCELEEQFMEKEAQGADPFAMLFRRVSQQKKFAKYAEKFEQFLVDLCELYLQLAKVYFDDNRLIAVIGKKEIVNMAEFKATDPMKYEIKIEPMSESLETMMGRHLTIIQTLQYAGKQLSSEDIGKMLKSLPFTNIEEAFEDFTLDYDNAKNDMLALDRGEFPPARAGDKHDYIIKKLSHRMRQPDFVFLDPMIQQAYQAKLSQHQDELAAEQEKILAAKNEFIPTDGPMVGVDLYVENKEDPSKAPKRARLPSRAVEWLVKHLEAQGVSLEKLEKMETSQLSQLSEKLIQQQAAIPEGGSNYGGYQ